MSDAEWLERVRDVDWTALDHAHGEATDMPERWAAFLEGSDEPEELLHAVCHQGTLYPCAAPLLPTLIALAKSEHPRAGDAAMILGAIVRALGGPLAHARRWHDHLAANPMPNPFTGEPIRASGEPPSLEAVHDERREVVELGVRVAEHVEAWRALASIETERGRAALFLLAGIAARTGDPELEAAVRDAMATLSDSNRSALAWVLDDLDRGGSSVNQAGRREDEEDEEGTLAARARGDERE